MTESASKLMDMRLLAAQAAAREAGVGARRRFLDRSFTVGFKGPQDFLTEVDGEATWTGTPPVGLPSGGGVVFADAVTLKSALEGRKVCQ